jgi:hypothetical protein
MQDACLSRAQPFLGLMPLQEASDKYGGFFQQSEQTPTDTKFILKLLLELGK